MPIANVAVHILSLAFAMLLAPALVTAAPEEMVTVCHVPPGNPADAHTISVSPFAVDAHLAHGDQLDSCAPVCRGEGQACTSSDQCCSENCDGSTCVPACTANGSTCTSNPDCCSDLCSAEGICASDCTIGPEFAEIGGTNCSVELPCCPGVLFIPDVVGPVEIGVCIFGACYAESTCALLDEACDDFDGPQCCFDYHCDNGTCVEP